MAFCLGHHVIISLQQLSECRTTTALAEEDGLPSSVVGLEDDVEEEEEEEVAKSRRPSLSRALMVPSTHVSTYIGGTRITDIMCIIVRITASAPRLDDLSLLQLS